MTYLLYNLEANNGKGEDSAKRALPYLFGKELKQVDLTGLDCKAFLQTLAPADEVVLVGGDGTLNCFVNAVYPTPLPCPFFLFRGGTGNDFLRDVTNADKSRPLVCINDYLQKLPTVTVGTQTRYFLNGIGYGLDGKVCEIADRRKENGKKKNNFGLIAFKELVFQFKPYHARVTVDGKTREFDRVYMAPAMNGRYFGGGFKSAPEQDRLGDTLTLVVVHDANKAWTISHFPTMLKGTHVKYEDQITLLSGKEIRVEFDRPCALQIDGETILAVRGYTAKKE